MVKIETIFRDIILLMLLAVLFKTAFEKATNEIQNSKSAWDPVPIHELDQDFLKVIDSTKAQIKEAISVAKKEKAPKETLQKLENLNDEVQQIEKKYKRNSPATFFLGPLGTTSIVMKEQKLEKKLSSVIIQLEETIDSITC